MIIGLDSLNTYIFGLNFFKNYYTVFDQEEMRIGFTQSKGINSRIDGLIKEVEERNELEAKMKKEEKEKPAEEEDKPEEEEEMSLV